jgi:hypothetical protein
MKRIHTALLVAIAVVIVWVGSTRNTSAQAPQPQQAQQVPGRYTISTVQSGSAGWVAIILDTQTGQTWYRENHHRGDKFNPLAGPVEPMTAERPTR